jgi:hypothetical protein
MADTPPLIQKYFQAFNERRFADAAEMFTRDAVIQHRPGTRLQGPDGYVESARMATTTFPDLQLQVLQVEQRGDTIFEIYLRGNGRHLADWTTSVLGTLKATGTEKTFHVRETLEIRGGKITFSSLTYDLHDFLGKPEPPG